MIVNLIKWLQTRWREDRFKTHLEVGMPGLPIKSDVKSDEK